MVIIHPRSVTCRPTLRRARIRPGRTRAGRPSRDARGGGARWNAPLVEDQPARSAPRLPRTTNGVRREHRILRSRVSFSSPRGASSGKCRERRVRSLRRPSALPAVHRSVKDSWSFAGHGSLSTASAITCVASSIVIEGTSPPTLASLADRARPDGASRRSLSARCHRARTPVDGCGETSAASTSILWGRPHALAVPMNRSECFECVLQEMSRGERAPAASTPVRTLRMAARGRVIHSPRWLPIAVRAGRSVSVGLHAMKPSRASLGAPLSWPKLAVAFVTAPCKQDTTLGSTSAPDGHRLWSSRFGPPVTEDTGRRARQGRWRLTSRWGSLRCHQMHRGGCDSSDHGATPKSGGP